MSQQDLSRRTFLGGTLAGSALLLAGCGGGGSGNSGGGTAGTGALPANSHLPTPDLPWTDHNVPPAYFKFPSVYQATSGAPGAGGPLNEVTWFSDQFGAPVTPFDSNPYWQELNRRLGVKVTPIWGPADSASYEQKFATILAGGDLPDLVLFSGTLGTPAQAQALQQGAFTDLTHYLTGSALNDYPNLALIPPKIWQNSMISGKLYGIPRPRIVQSSGMVIRQDWAQTVGVPYNQIKDAATFAQVMIDFHSKSPAGSQTTWGLPDIEFDFGAISSLNYGSEMFGAPNDWRLNKDGSLTKDIETAEFKAAVAWARDTFAKGGFHPDAATQTVTLHTSLFTSGKVGASLQALYATGGNTRALLAQLGFKDVVRFVLPPAAAGHKAVTFNQPGYNGFVTIPAKVGKDEAKVKQLLRIINYFSSPFGSEEAIFLQYGIKGLTYSLSPSGQPITTAVHDQYVGDLWRMFTPPQVNAAGSSNFFTDAEQQAWTTYLNGAYYDHYKLGVDDPTVGYFSQTSLRKLPALTNMIRDDLKLIISGRAPLSQLDQTISSFKSQGGDQIRREYQQAIQKHK